MEKRVIIFLVLSLAVILGYDLLLKQLGLLPPPETVQDSPAETTSTSAGGPDVSPAAPAGDRPVSSVKPEEASRQRSSSDQAEPHERIVMIETDLVRVGLDARGGVISSWELKRHHTAPPEEKPVQLVHQGAKFKGPLSVSTSDAAADKVLRDGVYAIETDFTSLDSAHPVGHATLRFRDTASGLTVLKRLTFHQGSYLVDVGLTIEGLAGAYDVVLGTNFGIVEWGDGFIGLIGSASLVDGKVEKETPDNELERKGVVQWVGLQDKYFISVLMPQGASAAVAKKEGEKLVSAGVRMPPPAGGATTTLQLYAGPKEYDTLRSLNVGLEETIDFEWYIFGSWSVVKAVAKPIFYVLRVINEYTHNYGVTIILLTMGIKLLFVPLQFKSYKSMKQMQMIQPRVLAVQEKYKDDRDKLNKELIKLYRDHKVNPVGG